MLASQKHLCGEVHRILGKFRDFYLWTVTSCENQGSPLKNDSGYEKHAGSTFENWLVEVKVPNGTDTL